MWTRVMECMPHSSDFDHHCGLSLKRWRPWIYPMTQISVLEIDVDEDDIGTETDAEADADAEA